MGHYYISKNQSTVFYRNKKSSEIAKKHGKIKFSNKKFVDDFCSKTLKIEKDLIKFLDDLNAKKLNKKDNKQLFSTYLKFFGLYSGLIGLFRCTRPEFYEFLTGYIKENVPEPKEEIMSMLLNNDVDKINVKIDKKTKELATNLYKLGRRRFEMHNTWLNSFIRAEELFKEIGKRINLTNMEVKNCLSSEIKSFLLGQKKPDKEEIQKRINFFKFEYAGKDFKLTTEKDGIPEEKNEEIKGQCANPGKMKSGVFILKESLSGVLAEQMKRMKNGDILVATNTSPDMMPAIEKASAIVTDEGGMLCHAAIVSREFNIPCIVGTGNATKVLKEGDLIEIDAEKGIVKRL